MEISLSGGRYHSHSCSSTADPFLLICLTQVWKSQTERFPPTEKGNCRIAQPSNLDGKDLPSIRMLSLTLIRRIIYRKFRNTFPPPIMVNYSVSIFTVLRCNRSESHCCTPDKSGVPSMVLMGAMKRAKLSSVQLLK